MIRRTSRADFGDAHRALGYQFHSRPCADCTGVLCLRRLRLRGFNAPPFGARSAQSRLEQSQSVRVLSRGLHHVRLDGLGARLRIALKVGINFTTAPHRNQRTCSTVRRLLDFSITPCATGAPGLVVAFGNAPRRRRVLLFVHMFRCPASHLLDPSSPNGPCPLSAQAQISGSRSVRLPRNCI